ncbi:SDR family NAD(P)-dependent oxidoreductase [Janibacter sp. YIM B02568]|uniref:SDR family NAD(P)-dependent oxidoreductase n=1 Tax=Janibacter endophyticus TaxID=2806261 RepID=UPI00194F0B17|nr:SDR family NAD(P)-dependent oxidoreductase [Janibacter endophyticus]MBM6545298.1 SDR family NAD(P)-dependent oxidoreductase [Janibacter endophyticus]
MSAEVAATTPGVAVVAGASRGLGLLISTELARRGFRVHGCGHSAATLDRAATLVAHRSGRGEGGPGGAPFVPSVCDVRDADAVQAWVERVLEDEGRIDVAIHVAGIIQVGPVGSTTLGHFRDAVETMLMGPVHLALSVLPTMRSAGRGRIGIVSSVGGVVSVPHLLPYSVAKFGAVGLSEGLHAELAGSGVTATTIVPGLMRTGGHVGAQFVGHAEHDYAWFAPGASMPVLSVGAERAARRIVDGVLAGRSQVELTPLTMVGRRVHGLAPALTVRAMGLASRILPEGPERGPSMSPQRPRVSGATARARLGSRVVNALSVLGDRAARRNNERV